MLSVCMIVKNEEKVLHNCLSSLNKAADEIIIVDTGSTDNTVAIAATYGAITYSFNWKNNFAEARNFALSKCRYDWILYIDADEYLDNNSQELLSQIKCGKADKGFYCKIENKDDISGRPSIMLYPRIFPNQEKIRFEGAVHEQIESSLLANKIPILQSEIKIIHTGYNINAAEKRIKAERNLNILLLDFKNKPDSYKAFQIGQSYGILENRILAEKYFLLSLKDKKLRDEYQALAYRYIGLNLADNNNLPEAEQYLINSLGKDPDQPLTLLALSELNKKKNEYDKAIEFCRKAFDCNTDFIKNNKKSFQTIFVNPELFYFHIIEIALCAKDSGPLQYFINEAPENLACLLKAIKILLDGNLNHEPLRLLCTNAFPSSISLFLALGKYFNGMGFYLEAEFYLQYSIEKGIAEASAYFYLISALLKNGNLPSALVYAERGFHIYKENKILYDTFSRILHQLKTCR